MTSHWLIRNPAVKGKSLCSLIQLLYSWQPQRIQYPGMLLWRSRICQPTWQRLTRVLRLRELQLPGTPRPPTPMALPRLLRVRNPLQQEARLTKEYPPTVVVKLLPAGTRHRYRQQRSQRRQFRIQGLAFLSCFAEGWSVCINIDRQFLMLDFNVFNVLWADGYSESATTQRVHEKRSGD